MSGKLIICGLPIGNPEDISQRVLKTLQSVGLIAAEDTRTAALFLSKFQIKKQLIAYHDFSDAGSRQEILNILKSKKNIALISDAGMPMISDPGYKLVQAALTAGIEIEVVPGPTALITALAVSGLPSDRFCFEGFLSNKPARRQEQLRALENESRTMIFYEAPHRIKETLEDMLNILGERQCFIGRELTKKYEEHLRGNLPQIISTISKNKPLGEYVIILSGDNRPEQKPELSPEIKKLVKTMKEHNLSNKDIVNILNIGLDINKNQLKKELNY